MVGKRSGRALLREEGKEMNIPSDLPLELFILIFSQGLERTDNNLDLTTWPQVNMINQKNYYT